MIDYAAIDSVIGENWYLLDPDLQARVRRDAPAEDLEWAERKLTEFGELVGGPIARNSETVDANPPRLVKYDRWANDVDEIAHHPAALETKRLLWEVGYVSGFAADERERGRTTPAVVLAGVHYLLSQADTGMVCSLGMTSGVAGLVEAYGPPDVRDRLLEGLRATDFEKGTDGSMFLTERDGGSDLGRTVHCVAKDIGDGRVLISGEKWFCSNIDGEAIVMLARPEGAPDGPGGIGLYLVPRHLEDGTRNSYRIRRLKDKLGTKSVPTGEVVFEDALGYALRPRREDGTLSDSDAGGLNRMMEMVNGSRFGVAMMGLGIARRCFLEAAVWAHHREAKGRLLVDLPLMREQLVDLLVELEAAFALGFECAAAGRQENGLLLRRVLIPAAKVRLCRFGVEAASAAIETLGGNGYCEDWHLTRQLRDAQCHPIWEGTENICALDVLRAIRRDGAHTALLARIDRALEAARGGAPGFVQPAVARIGEAREELAARIDKIDAVDLDRTHANAGRLTHLVCRVTAAALLAEQAVDDNRKGLVTVRYVRKNLAPEEAWDDQTAAVAGREMLAFAEIDDKTAERAAA
ncbi:MAG: DNA alkylation response protein [Acidimicrobiales bacterium]|nr:MAG: DNA alkylation response protein [Acidimicrobiales bacterium]